MNHPSREEWMSYLYDELEPSARPRLQAHLRVCPECFASVQAWRKTMKGLDTWKLEPKPAADRAPAAWPALAKWAAAVAVLVGLAWWLGRNSASLEDMQAELLPVLRAQLRDELRADLLAALAPGGASVTNDFQRGLRATFTQWAAHQREETLEENQQLVGALVESVNAARTEDRAAMLALAQRLDQQNRTAYTALRKNLETVAVVADNRFQQTENQLGQLISYAVPAQP